MKTHHGDAAATVRIMLILINTYINRCIHVYTYAYIHTHTYIYLYMIHM